jgi:hypothetical protein
MAEAAASLGAAWQRFEGANALIMAAAKPFYADLGRDGVAELAREMNADFSSPKPYVGAAIVDAGLTLQSNHFQHISSRWKGTTTEKQPPLPQYVDERNAVLRRMVEPIEPQNVGEAA